MAICRNTQNNFPYRYLGNNKFRNVATGQEGEVPEEKAKDIFKINLEATEICEQFQIVEEFIKALGLKFDNNKK